MTCGFSGALGLRCYDSGRRRRGDGGMRPPVSKLWWDVPPEIAIFEGFLEITFLNQDFQNKVTNPRRNLNLGVDGFDGPEFVPPVKTSWRRHGL